MARRRVAGSLLIAASGVCFVAALLDLPVQFHIGAGLGQLLSRSAPFFWLILVCGLVYAVGLSTVARDRIGLVLGAAGLGLVAAYLAEKHLDGVLTAVLAPILVLGLSVVVTILGWHLVMPQRSTTVAQILSGKQVERDARGSTGRE